MQIELIASHVERMPSYETLYFLRGSVQVSGKVYNWHYEMVPAHALPHYKERIASEIVKQLGITNKIKELI